MKPATLTRNQMSLDAPSYLSFIDQLPSDPVQLFSKLLRALEEDNQLLRMNIATVDREFGVLNRTVNYRGLTDNHVTFITERNSRKYLNIKENRKVSVTFFFGKLNLPDDPSIWQVRIFGEAFELNHDQISKHWEAEPVFAKVRSRICECGKPIDPAELSKTHDALLKAYQDGEDQLPQTETYTGFKIVPTVWDFYKSEMSSIADRVVYKKLGADAALWSHHHVAA